MMGDIRIGIIKSSTNCPIELCLVENPEIHYKVSIPLPIAGIDC